MRGSYYRHGTPVKGLFNVTEAVSSLLLVAACVDLPGCVVTDVVYDVTYVGPTLYSVYHVYN